MIAYPFNRISPARPLFQHDLDDQTQPTEHAQLSDADLGAILPEEALANLHLFDRLQLEAVVRICRGSRTLSEAGRRLFDQSRNQRAIMNDADRLRKHLLKLGLSWDAIHA